MNCPDCARPLRGMGNWCAACQKSVPRWPLLALLITVIAALIIAGLLYGEPKF